MEIKKTRRTQLCWFCANCCSEYKCSQVLGIAPLGAKKNKLGFIYECPNFVRDVGEMSRPQFMQKFNISRYVFDKCIALGKEKIQKQLTELRNIEKDFKNLDIYKSNKRLLDTLSRKITQFEKMLYICDNFYLIGNLDKSKYKD